MNPDSAVIVHAERVSTAISKFCSLECEIRPNAEQRYLEFYHTSGGIAAIRIEDGRELMSALSGVRRSANCSRQNSVQQDLSRGSGRHDLWIGNKVLQNPSIIVG